MSFVNGKETPWKARFLGKLQSLQTNPSSDQKFQENLSKLGNQQLELGKVGEIVISTQTKGRLPIQKKILRNPFSNTEK